MKLNPDKHDKTHTTFGTLSKTYPTLWVCCDHHDCMVVYDVTSANDTQRNIHLTAHHTLGVKSVHSHQALQNSRLGTLSEKNATAKTPVWGGLIYGHQVDRDRGPGPYPVDSPVLNSQKLSSKTSSETLLVRVKNSTTQQFRGRQF